MLWSWIKILLFRFDAERVHDWTHWVLKHLGSNPVGKKILVEISGSKKTKTALCPNVFGITFRSPVGLAAGFDKNAELLGALPHLGFGFAEIGTVTPYAQPGNSKPRLARDPRNCTLFNRMGFNGLGAEAVSNHLRHARLKGEIPIHFRVGVNLGKNKATTAADAHLDYALAASHFENLADYFVLNVSSPNTPGLRDLQALESIQKIVSSVDEALSQWRVKPPLLLKLAPELEGKKLKEILTLGERLGVAGFVLTNTWGGEWKKSPSSASLSGGWSGSNLTEISLQRLCEAKSHSHLPVISVGGIMTLEDAQARLQAGASLIQVYTGWIYGGPRFPAQLANYCKI